MTAVAPVSALFRPEAVRAASAQQLGQPISLMPWSWWALTGFLVVFAAATVTFLAAATFPRKETAAGVLRYSLGELRVTPPRAGIVRSIAVQDGQVVKEGETLAYVSTEQRLAAGEAYDSRVLAAIAREREMLEARLNALDRSEPLQARALSERIAGVSQQLNELQADRKGRAARSQLAAESLAAADTLAAQGVYSAEQRRARQQQALALEQAVSQMAAQIAALESQRTDLMLQLARLPTDIAQTRAAIMGSVEALEEKRASADAQNGFALLARASGTVTALQAQPGQPVDASKPLMAVVPRGSTLVAELYVPSRAIAFVAKGQRVRLLYDAFPYTRFGPGFGTIMQISSAVLRPEEVTAAVRVTEPAYRVLVSLEASVMAAYGRDVPLQSGMALTADILLESRSFLDLLFDPLLAARGRILGG